MLAAISFPALAAAGDIGTSSFGSAPMIESAMVFGIGLLVGCLLMLFCFPFVHARAVRLTRRDFADATPLTVREIQVEKDQMRAQFAVSVRRLEIGMEQMRAKALDRSADRQLAQVGRLQVELDKKSAMILALRAREQVRKRLARRIVKLALYLLARSKRKPAPPVFDVPVQPSVEHDLAAAELAAADLAAADSAAADSTADDLAANARELASAAAAIAAVNFKRRRAAANRY